MIIQLIKSYQHPVQKMGGTYCGRRLEPVLYGGRQGERVVTGKTREEVIKKLMAHPNSFYATFGKNIQDCTNEELVDISLGKTI